jgi:hypothetical protein
MVLLFYFEGMGVERPIFRFFDLAGEYLKGTEKTSGTITRATDSLFFVSVQATGSSPPVKGIGHIIKRRNAGAIKRDGNKQPVCIYAVILHPVKHRHAIK